MTQINRPTTIKWDGASPLASNVSAHTAPVATLVGFPEVSTDGVRRITSSSFVSFVDLITDGARRIRKRPGKGSAIGSSAGTAITALYEYERVDPTTGAATFYVFRGTATGIDRWLSGAWAAQSLPITVSGSQWTFCNFANRCFAVNGADEAIVFDGSTWKLVGIDDPIPAATYSLSGDYVSGTLTCTQGSPAVVGTIPAIWFSTDADLFIDINGARYQIDAVTAFGNGFSLAPQLTLSENFKEATASGLTYVLHRGLMSWDTPPKYAWSYYNPTTGHVSNRSPITEITEKNDIATPTLTIAGSAENTAAYFDGYTQLKIFRTALDGNQLVAIDATVFNNNAGNAITFIESGATCLDKFLTNEVAPLTTNKRPPTALTSIVAYMGRLWALRPSDPTNTPPDAPRLYFSALYGTVSEIPFGVGEESWPRLYSRSGIAQPRGLIVIGAGGPKNSLVIQASDNDYSLDGYDNTTFTDPYPLGSRRAGGFFGGAIAVEDRLIQFYRDKRLIDSGNGDIGLPVQDKINGLNSSVLTGSRLAYFSFQNSNYLLLSGPNGAGTNNYSLIFDYDFGRINEWNFGFSASAVVHNASGDLELWVGDSSGSVFKLVGAGTWQDAGSDFAPTFTTSHLDFGHLQRLARARIWVGPTGSGAEALTWTLTVYKDEDTTGTPYVFSAAPAMFQSAQGRELVYEFEKPVISQIFQAKVTFPSANQDLTIDRFELTFDDVQEPRDET